ncbi:MAG: hypothetical protein FVQ79_06915 [Planctomycetes bacterium]|nr:hypothetical protein [Planctomycetota bacterium]
MTKAENIKKKIEQINVKSTPQMRNRILPQASQAMEQTLNAQAEMPSVWRIIMKSRMTKLAVAAAVIIIAVLAGINPFGGSIDVASVAWGQEIIAAIETIKGVSCREQIFTVTKNGSKHLSSTWNILYFSKDSYRRDIYDGDKLREIQWYVPEGETMLQHSIRFDIKSYFVEQHQGSFGVQDPIDRVRFYVQFMDSAEHLVGTKNIEGTNCVGFEIKASEYGSNPEHWVDKIWFDVETKLPVVIEQHGRPVTDRPEMTFTTVKDDFNYGEELPGNTFEPYVPDGYIFGHPDEITSK